VTGAAGLLSFAGAFAFAWFSNRTPASDPQGPQQPAHVVDQSLAVEPAGQVEAALSAGAPPGPMKKAMTEQQLKNLVQEVRQKMQEYSDRLQAIAMRERRLEVAQNVLKDDIESLDNLRLEVASAITTLKGERDALLKSRLEIDQKEKTNLITIAATYDKMDVTGAGKILISLCQPADSEPGEPPNLARKSDSYDDAVKILHYMTERTKAKLLAELATSEPVLAAGLCQRLKQIVEGR
jgi:hypothetical protein